MKRTTYKLYLYAVFDIAISNRLKMPQGAIFTILTVPRRIVFAKAAYMRHSPRRVLMRRSAIIT